MKSGQEKIVKTNAMRLLDRAKASYEVHSFDCPEALSAPEVAVKLGQNPAQVFKTLVTSNEKGSYFVFLVPGEAELDLKKAASAVGEKSVHMVKSKELFPLTGYVHGGCSPLGMKKQFVTCIDSSAQAEPRLFFSGGKIGVQIETTLAELSKALDYQLEELV